MNKRGTHIFILRWNPRKSVFKAGDYEVFFKLATTGGTIQEFWWEVHDWKKVAKNDVFFFARVGTDRDGILMHGLFAGECQLDKNNPDGTEKKLDKHNKTHSARLLIKGMFKDNEVLSAESLEKTFPEIDWHSDSAGELLPGSTGRRLVSHVEKAIRAEIESANDDDADDETDDNKGESSDNNKSADD
ncbi:MAG TPA: hypothetical protein DCO86_01750 [Spirochaetaceae bacterium]|nr:hypothetical protein [Spirochaetaceae bacterium]